MGGEWLKCTLADACSSIDYGLTASAADHQNGPYFLRITDIVSGHIDWNTVPHVDADEATLAKYRLHDGDIVLARTGASTGASAYVKKPPSAVFASYLVRLQSKPNFDSRFLSYYLRSDNFWTFIRAVLGDKSAQPNASASTMTKAPLCVPNNKNEQRRIAHILGTLDDKIENNRKTAKTLEAMAQAIFQSWFVDFDPVRAKMAGESPESICKRLKLTLEILDLFPDRLVDSELGEIPDGWLTTTLETITSRIKRGISPAYSDGYGILILNQKCIREFMVDTSKARRHDPAVRSIEGLLLEVGDVLVNSTGVGTLGRVAQVLHIQESCIIDSHVTLVRPDNKYPWSYLGQLIMTLQPQIEEMGEGSTGQTELSRGKLANLLITLPITSILEKYHNIILPVNGRISDCERQIQILKNIRDTLLPKLISGEIRVPEACHVEGSYNAAYHG